MGEDWDDALAAPIMRDDELDELRDLGRVPDLSDEALDELNRQWDDLERELSVNAAATDLPPPSIGNDPQRKVGVTLDQWGQYQRISFDRAWLDDVEFRPLEQAVVQACTAARQVAAARPSSPVGNPTVPGCVS